MADIKLRLKREVFDSLMADRGATVVADEVQITGVPERTIRRIRNGSSPSMSTALRMADRLGVPIAVLFERVEEPATNG